MRDFSWHVFSATGNIDAYLLYKETTENTLHCEREVTESEETDDQTPFPPYH